MPRWGRIVAAAALGLAVWLATARLEGQDRNALIAQGQQLFMAQGCYGCHTVGAVGTPIAPDLSHVGSRYREPDLARWLSDPSAQKPTRHMPQIQLSSAEAAALAAYLASLQ